jgi:spore germination protein KC
MKKTLAAVFAVLILLTSVGCNSYVPYIRLEQRIMVQLVGVDYHDGEYKISLQFSMGRTSDGGRNENDLSTVTGHGKNLYSAVKDARSLAGKEFFFTHNQVLILGEEIIKNSPIKTIEEYLNYCDSHSTALVTGVFGKAEDVISLTYKDEYSDKNKIMLILENANTSGIYPAYMLYETLMNSKSTSGSCFIPMLRVVEDRTAQDGEGSSIANQNGEEESGESDSGQPNVIPYGGALIIDNKLAKFMDARESKGLSMLVNSSIISSVDVEHDSEKLTFEIFKKRTKIFPRYNGDNLVFHVKFSAIAEKSYNYIFEKKSHNQKHYEELMKEEILQYLHNTVTATIAVSGDLISLEDSLKHCNYSLWTKVEDDWREAIKNAEFVYSVKMKIQ